MSLDLWWPTRPIDQWVGEETPERRPSPFSAEWRKTRVLMRDELRHLDAIDIVVLVDVLDRDLRQDGEMRANARPPGPRVALSMTTPYGPLRYQCDAFTKWRDNFRAIALGLESLRRVERYGIASRGEQYRGFNALGAGTALGQMTMSPGEAAAVFLDLVGTGSELDPTAPMILAEADAGDPKGVLARLYKAASKRYHPDAGGERNTWDALETAWRVLSG